VLLIGIGGWRLDSSWSRAPLETVAGRRRLFVLDNTDPDGWRACSGVYTAQQHARRRHLEVGIDG
jgi:hypothetical protein